MNIAVLGSDDFVTGFRLAGVRETYVCEGKELNERIEQIIQEGTIGILVMEQNEHQQLRANVKKKLERAVTPVVVTLSAEGQAQDIREMVKRSIGIDLWK